MKASELRLKLFNAPTKYAITRRMAVQILTMRGAAGLTQQQLAKKLNTKQENIARWEASKHEPSLSTLQRIAKATGFTMKDPEFLLDKEVNR